jgi:hypothetical protein
MARQSVELVREKGGYVSDFIGLQASLNPFKLSYLADLEGCNKAVAEDSSSLPENESKPSCCIA